MSDNTGLLGLVVRYKTRLDTLVERVRAYRRVPGSTTKAGIYSYMDHLERIDDDTDLYDLRTELNKMINTVDKAIRDYEELRNTNE